MTIQSDGESSDSLVLKLDLVQFRQILSDVHSSQLSWVSFRVSSLSPSVKQRLEGLSSKDLLMKCMGSWKGHCSQTEHGSGCRETESVP